MHADTPGSISQRDQALISRIRLGEEAAMSELLRTYGVKLMRAAVPITGSEDVAQDVVQDVFIRIWDTRTQLEIRGSVAAYLYRAVRNRALDIRKHERAQRSLESRLLVEYEHEYEGEPSGTRHADMPQDGLTAEVEQALASLSPRTREIFLLRVEHGLSSS